MDFWIALGATILASAVVYLALSINGVTEVAGGQGHDDQGHDDHGHGHH